MLDHATARIINFGPRTSVSDDKFEESGTRINCSESVDEYLSKADWRINANANVGYSHAGLVNNIAGKVIANFWLDEVYDAEEGRAHREGDYHIHDLDSLAGYCAGWSLRQLLAEGFNGVTGRVSSRPPRHFREALGQMAISSVFYSPNGRALRHSVRSTPISRHMSSVTNWTTTKSAKPFASSFII